jgi:uncharacterized membrane protein YdjX (TVP38/TMEM64 family)
LGQRHSGYDLCLVCHLCGEIIIRYRIYEIVYKVSKIYGKGNSMAMQKKKGWLLLGTMLLAFILVPFFLFGENIEAWTRAFLESAASRPLLVALVLGGLLATDIFLPVPSSVISTAAGLLLGFVGGMLTSLIGMIVSCMAGFWLGARFGRPLAGRLVGAAELRWLEEKGHRLGDWVVVIARPIPVLAEASVLFAGTCRMPLNRFIMLSTLSNLAISAVYAAIGAMSATVNSFLLAMAGSILVPWLVMVVFKRR